MHFLLEPIHCLRRHWLIMLLLAVLGGLQALPLTKYLSPVSRDAYIDLNSGLLRYEYSFLCIHYKTRVWEGSVARRYKKYVGPLPAEHDWVYCSTLGMGGWRNKPAGETKLSRADFEFQNALGNILEKQKTWPHGNQYSYTPDAKRVVILESLKLLKEDQSANLSLVYLLALDEYFANTDHPVRVDELPTWEELRKKH